MLLIRTCTGRRAESLDISPSFGPADCCAQGDDDHIDQQMTLRPVHSWIGQVIEV